MIQKFLVVGKSLRVCTTRPADVLADAEVVLGLTLPLEAFWEMTELIKSIDYLQSTSEPSVKINEVHMTIFKLVAPYAANDKDRAWLYDRIQGKSVNSD